MTEKVTRKNIRYKPDRLESAQIMYQGESERWHADDVALIIDESAVAGAQLILKFTDQCKAGSKVKVQLGRLEPILGEVVWRREVDADIIRIGVRFLE